MAALRAERTTSKRSSSWKAGAAWAVGLVFLNHSAEAEAFVAQLVQLVRPETSPTQIGDCENVVSQ